MRVRVITNIRTAAAIWRPDRSVVHYLDEILLFAQKWSFFRFGRWLDWSTSNAIECIPVAYASYLRQVKALYTFRYCYCYTPECRWQAGHHPITLTAAQITPRCSIGSGPSGNWRYGDYSRSTERGQYRYIHVHKCYKLTVCSGMLHELYGNDFALVYSMWDASARLYREKYEGVRISN